MALLEQSSHLAAMRYLRRWQHYAQGNAAIL
jgi:hypothetical protein